jgi:hypothetical protein
MLRSPKPVDRVDFKDLTEKSFTFKYRNKKPVLITGFVSSWSALSLWTDEYLERRVVEENGRSRNIEVFVSKDNTHFLDQEGVVDKISMDFDQFLQIVPLASRTDGKRYYLRCFVFPELLRDVIFPKQLLFEYARGMKGFNEHLSMLCTVPPIYASK